MHFTDWLFVISGFAFILSVIAIIFVLIVLLWSGIRESSKYSGDNHSKGFLFSDTNFDCDCSHVTGNYVSGCGGDCGHHCDGGDFGGGYD